MKFTENGRISHRQLYRQMVLALLAPLLLCVTGPWRVRGINGILGTAAAVILLLFYVIFLIRLAPYFNDTVKTCGGFMGGFTGAFFIVYILLSGAYILAVLSEIIPQSLVSGVSGKWISLAAVLVCSVGTNRGMQRRGRMAEVSGGVLLFGIFLMMIICLGQGNVSYLQEMAAESGVSGTGFMKAAYVVLCAFSAVGLMPFLLEDVEKQGSAGKSAAFGILTLGGILLGMELILLAVFGFGRLRTEKYPILPLMAGADLPGNVLARFDVLWMAFLLGSLLFSVGSLLHYGHLIIRKSHLGTGRFWMAAVMYLLSFMDFKGVKIMDFYGEYLGFVFVPGLLILQIYIFWTGRGKQKKRFAAAVSASLILSLFAGGCSSAVEPEKRIYPLALGVDASGEGFRFTYAMPDMAQATGQSKGGEEAGNNENILTFSGENFEEIKALYNRSQEKFLDMGHLEILVLGDSILDDDRWKMLLDYLGNEPFVGENIYVFRAKSAEETLKIKGPRNSSAGEYLKGLVENRMAGQKKKTVNLREVFHEKYKTGTLPKLPEIHINGENPEVLWG